MRVLRGLVVLFDVFVRQYCKEFVLLMRFLLLFVHVSVPFVAFFGQGSILGILWGLSYCFFRGKGFKIIVVFLFL
jgi:hypothetical protein